MPSTYVSKGVLSQEEGRPPDRSRGLGPLGRSSSGFRSRSGFCPKSSALDLRSRAPGPLPCLILIQTDLFVLSEDLERPPKKAQCRPQRRFEGWRVCLRGRWVRKLVAVRTRFPGSAGLGAVSAFPRLDSCLRRSPVYSLTVPDSPSHSNNLRTLLDRPTPPSRSGGIRPFDHRSRSRPPPKVPAQTEIRARIWQLVSARKTAQRPRFVSDSVPSDRLGFRSVVNRYFRCC